MAKKNQNEACDGCCHHLVIQRTRLKSNNACKTSNKTTSFHVICDWCFCEFVM